MPGTLLGLVALGALVVPGYIWVRFAEISSSRPERSGLMEAAELTSAGTVATLAAGSLVAWFGPVEFDRFIAQGGEYIQGHAGEVVAAGLWLLVLSWGGTLLIAWAKYGGRRARFRPGSTAWVDALQETSRHRAIYMRVRFADGTGARGEFGTVTHNPDAAPDLGLRQPLALIDEDGTERPIEAQWLLVRADEVKHVELIPVPYEGQPHTRWRSGLAAWLRGVADRLGS